MRTLGMYLVYRHMHLPNIQGTRFRGAYAPPKVHHYVPFSCTLFTTMCTPGYTILGVPIHCLGYKNLHPWFVPCLPPYAPIAHPGYATQGCMQRQGCAVMCPWHAPYLQLCAPIKHPGYVIQGYICNGQCTFCVYHICHYMHLSFDA